MKKYDADDPLNLLEGIKEKYYCSDCNKEIKREYDRCFNCYQKTNK